ncbi:WecB/TagA/CpsF family glycosyltransferase [Viridibacillus sp. NPDC096237]|uniref:WecB/TagA/CpsF family glycosyltransferase n=1 Tax=Viridibacillus sp. NPDC096237 TaxID=3390721 RepID=UPI003D03D67B
MKKIDILSIPIADTTKKEFVNTVTKQDGQVWIVTANPEIIMLAKELPTYEKLLHAADYVVADGIGVVIGSKMLGQPLQERIPGFELVHEFMADANATGTRNKIFMYGGKPGIAAKAAEAAKAQYPNIDIVGVADGFGGDGNAEEVALKASALSPDYVFVALGAPKQEEWIAAHREKFPNAILMGVGGSLDILSGNIDRAPDIFLKLNLEWFHRLITQPTRWKRMLKIPQFLLAVRRNGRK